jgi:hypothetical protein
MHLYVHPSMDPGRTPRRVGQAHVTDQPTNFERHLWSAAAKSRIPSPEQTKTSTMPADDRGRLDNHQSIQSPRCNPVEGRKNEVIEIAKGEPPLRVFSQHIELVAQRQRALL